MESRTLTFGEGSTRKYCMLHQKDGWKAREVQIEASNDKFVLIQTGLKEDDQVAMNPRGLLDIVQLPKIVEKPRPTVASSQPVETPAEPPRPDGSALTERRRDGGAQPSPAGGDSSRPETARSSVSSAAVDTTERPDENRQSRISQPSSEPSESFSDAGGPSDVTIDSAAAERRDKTASDPRNSDTSGGALP